MSPSEIASYTPVSFSLLEGRLINLMTGRTVASRIQIGTVAAVISLALPETYTQRPRPLAPFDDTEEPDGPDLPGTTAGKASQPDLALDPDLTLGIDGRNFSITFAGTRHLYQLLESADPNGLFAQTPVESLPSHVLWGGVESFIGPEVARLEALLGTEVALVDPEPVMDALPLDIHIEYQQADGALCKVQGCLSLPNDTRGLDWLAKLVMETARHTWRPEQTLALEKTVGLQAGTIKLTLGQFRELEPGDVLLPDTWLPNDARLALGLPDAALVCAMDLDAMTLTLSGIRQPLAEPVSLVLAPEPDSKSGPEYNLTTSFKDDILMENELESLENEVADTLSPGTVTIDSNNIELDLIFELGRMTMTVAEISQFAAGQIITLPRAPKEGVNVDIRVNSQVVAKARIVTVGEDVGIQIIQAANK